MDRLGEGHAFDAHRVDQLIADSVGITHHGQGIGVAVCSGYVLETHGRDADLERGEFEIEPGAYDLICVFYYLQRDLFQKIRASVKPGGLAIAAIHTVDDSLDIKPMNPAFLLQPSELRAEFRGWEILHDYEGKPGEEGHQRRTAEIVARKK